jgi:O-antigen/teichoic acid export membrane protein
MGIVVRQSFYTSISSYVGVALGALNTMVLFPNLYKDDPNFVGEVGLFLNTALILATFANLGAPITVSSFFPKYSQTLKNKYLASVGLLVVGLALAGAFGVAIISLFYDRTLPLIIIISLGFFVALFEIIASVAQDSKRVVFPTILRGVFRRLVLTVAILTCFLLDWESQFFYAILTGGYFLHFLLVLPYLGFLNFTLTLPSKKDWRLISKLIKYGIVSVLGAGALLLVSRIDIIVISLLLGKASVAFYGIAFFVGNSVSIPTKTSLYNLRPHIAKLWNTRDWLAVETLYKKNSVAQFFVASSLLLLVWLNLDLIYQIIPPKFRVSQWVVLTIGLTEVFVVSTSFNGILLALGKKQQQHLYMAVSLIALTIITDFLLIPYFGLVGAALATLISLVLYNVFKSLAVYFYFNFSSFSASLLKLVLIFIACLLVTTYIKHNYNVLGLAWFLSNILLVVAILFTLLKFKGLEEFKASLLKILKK